MLLNLSPSGRLLLLGVLLGGRTAVGPVRALEVVEQRRELLPARHLGTHALHALDRILPLLPREVHGLERMRLGVVTRRARVLVDLLALVRCDDCARDRE